MALESSPDRWSKYELIATAMSGAPSDRIKAPIPARALGSAPSMSILMTSGERTPTRLT
jgi:hypothetical protein